jgi:hypothetical protein
MDDHALKQSDYSFVEWYGRTPVAAPPPAKPQPEIDTTRISLASDRELRYWTDEFRVTIYDIRDAIAATGSRCPNDVRHYLARRVEEYAAELL